MVDRAAVSRLPHDNICASEIVSPDSDTISPSGPSKEPSSSPFTDQTSDTFVTTPTPDVLLKQALSKEISRTNTAIETSLPGPLMRVGTYAELRQEKSFLDWQRYDFETRPYPRPSYESEAWEVTENYASLIANVYQHGDRFPRNQELHRFEYQDVVRSAFDDMISVLRAYEVRTGDFSIRARIVRDLYFAAQFSDLANRSSFYSALLQDIWRESI